VSEQALGSVQILRIGIALALIALANPHDKLAVLSEL
jgi:hypothetical protein